MEQPQPHPQPPADGDSRLRWRAGLISLLVGFVLLLAKFEAWHLTHSQAVLSDALESIVNVVAAAFALVVLWYAAFPADRNHPYGHGKVEFFAAAFEGGLIAFAAALILWEAGGALLQGQQAQSLGLGTLIVAVAGGINGLLGLFLLRTGRKHHSITLVADGQHVLSDFWTSVGVVVGLLCVWLTGLWWLDPLIAAVVALHLLWTGYGLVRHAAGGLLDEEDPELLGKIVQVLTPHVGAHVVRVHMLRAIRAGRFHHVSAHLVVPEFLSVERAHDLQEALAAKVIQALAVEGELTFHTDPCHRAYCRMCDVPDCPVRTQPFAGRPALTVDEAIQPDQPPPR